MASFKKNPESKKLHLIATNFFVLAAMAALLELASGYLLSLKDGAPALLRASRSIATRINSGNLFQNSRYFKIHELRKEGVKNVYPYYLYDPQAHEAGSEYWLTKTADSQIVYCDEGEGLLTFKTNSLGLRKTKDESLRKPIDIILLGDSYAEGACVASPFDIASQIRIKTKLNTINAGVGGTGPLLQLAVLRELLHKEMNEIVATTDRTRVIWLIFTGNDLQNLAEERATSVANYLSDKEYKTGYFRNTILGKLKNKQESFFRDVLSNPSSNSPLSNHGYGETAAKKESFSEKTALKDLKRIIGEVRSLLSNRGISLTIVTLENHRAYDRELMKKTTSIVKESCKELAISCISYDMSSTQLPRGHLNKKGYEILTGYILSRLPR